jgi:hypothetical protein
MPLLALMLRGSALWTLLNPYGALVDFTSVTLTTFSAIVGNSTYSTHHALSPYMGIPSHYDHYSHIWLSMLTTYSPSFNKPVLRCVLLRWVCLVRCCRNLTEG